MTTPTGTAAPGDHPAPPSPSPLYTRPTQAQSAREQTVSYADLMKPDEDWRNLPNAADRRKIQNRLAQRAYRRSLKERNEEIKRLRKQVEKLEETQAQAELATPPRDPDSNPGLSRPSLAGPGGPGTTTNHDTGGPATGSVISEPDWMGDYLGIWPHTPPPGPDHDPFAGLSHGQVKAWGSGFPSMDSATDGLLQPVPEHSLRQHAGTSTGETVRSSPVSYRPQHHGDGGSSSSTGDGNNNTFAYPPTPIGPDAICHSRGHSMDVGDPASPAPPASPNLDSFTLGNTTPSLHPVTPRLLLRRNNDVYSDDGSSGKASLFSNHHPRLQMETGASNSYNEAGHLASASCRRSPTSAPSWCCCISGGHHAADTTSGFSVRGRSQSHAGKEHERPRTSIQPLDMDSLYTQGHVVHRGLVVQPSECGDGVTIRLQPTAANARASLVAFMIQHDPAPLTPLNDKQPCRMDHDSHH
ncbi:uncharacterized protein C8A04DRAFT_32797 [Dichotomopilus funicola]|uniref:BZIP domain-containing protein n=1 Tax=Dichotomopilus funicola TaxID=1934379 RepID=A0AAN6UVD8_9PEZI|nr:hypothetical protein C8A04DRAFT_32797 [Dichotomopilus funicola]